MRRIAIPSAIVLTVAGWVGNTETRAMAQGPLPRDFTYTPVRNGICTCCVLIVTASPRSDDACSTGPAETDRRETIDNAAALS